MFSNVGFLIFTKSNSIFDVNSVYRKLNIFALFVVVCVGIYWFSWGIVSYLTSHRLLGLHTFDSTLTTNRMGFVRSRTHHRS